MADLVKLTIDGQAGARPRRGTLLIDAAKTVGIEIPAFCYYEGLTLQAACRMCLVEVEKMPKLMTAARCRWPKAWWCAPKRRQVAQARKCTLEFLLTNHPLDCPVCDKGGECELQDMVFRYGAGESRFTEEQAHTSTRSSGRRWSTSMRRAASSAYRCVRVCNEGHGRRRAGRRQSRRGLRDRAEPRRSSGMRRVRRVHRHLPGRRADQRHLPLSDAAVGDDARRHHLHALRRTAARRRWACATTRSSAATIATARGINGEFLCIKGRYAFDFYEHPERLQSPLMRVNGKLRAGVLGAGAASGGAEVQRESRRAAASSASSARTTPPTKRISTCRSSRARCCGTNNIDHHRTGDVATLLDALSGKTSKRWRRSAICTNARPCWSSAPIWRSSIRCSLSRSAPTTGIIRRTSTR